MSDLEEELRSDYMVDRSDDIVSSMCYIQGLFIKRMLKWRYLKDGYKNN